MGGSDEHGQCCCPFSLGLMPAMRQYLQVIYSVQVSVKQTNSHVRLYKHFAKTIQPLTLILAKVGKYLSKLTRVKMTDM